MSTISRLCHPRRTRRGSKSCSFCHSGEGQNPVCSINSWILASARMTRNVFDKRNSRGNFKQIPNIQTLGKIRMSRNRKERKYEQSRVPYRCFKYHAQTNSPRQVLRIWIPFFLPTKHVHRRYGVGRKTSSNSWFRYQHRGFI